MADTIIIGAETLAIRPMDFEALQIILPRVPEAHAWALKGLSRQEGEYVEFLKGAKEGIESAMMMIAAATGMPIEDVRKLPGVTAIQAAEAIEDIGIISHVLVPKKASKSTGDAAGEALGAA